MTLFVVVVIAFACLCTAHVAVVAGLVTRPPRWRGLLAFFVPPSAPFFAYAAGLRGRAVLWCVTFVLYAVALVLAWRA